MENRIISYIEKLKERYSAEYRCEIVPCTCRPEGMDFIIYNRD